MEFGEPTRADSLELGAGGQTAVAQVPLPITVWVLRSDEGILEQALAKKHTAPL